MSKTFAIGDIVASNKTPNLIGTLTNLPRNGGRGDGLAVVTVTDWTGKATTLLVALDKWHKVKADNDADNQKHMYHIVNIGCDDETNCGFDFTEEEATFLKRVFDELNTHSSYDCMPKIYIEKVEVE